MGIVTKPGWQMAVFDAPGIHKPKNKLGRHMMNTALSVLELADVIYYLADASCEFGAGEAYIIQILEKVKKPVFLLLNKTDLLEKEKLLPIIKSYHEKREFDHIFPISALTGDNIPRLLTVTAELLPEGPPCFDEDEMTDQPARVMATEMIREKAMLAVRQEVPYALAVYVEKMELRRQGLMDIHGVIAVEQDSQKGILIGKNGATLQWVGSSARKDIEELLGVSVNLQLWVKVRKDWRNQEQQLREYGLTNQ